MTTRREKWSQRWGLPEPHCPSISLPESIPSVQYLKEAETPRLLSVSSAGPQPLLLYRLWGPLADEEETETWSPKAQVGFSRREPFTLSCACFNSMVCTLLRKRFSSWAWWSSCSNTSLIPATRGAGRSVSSRPSRSCNEISPHQLFRYKNCILGLA